MNPEVQESLNILRPPVQRLFKNHWYCKEEAPRNNVEVNRDLCTTPTELINNTWDVRDTTSSLSLIVKKSDENLIVEKYSVLSYTNLQFSKVSDHRTSSIDDPETVKPVIKVTVIPNNTSVKRKKRSGTKRIESTVSNQESSIKSENVYLVIKNRKHEKVFEVKSSGSAEFSKRNNRRQLKNEEFSVKQNVKQLLKSLNMDTKKKKGRRKRATGEDEEEYEDEQFERYSGTGRCTCSRPIGSYDIFANTMVPAQMEQNVKQHLKSLQEKKMRNVGKIQLQSEEMPSEEEPFEKITYDCKCQPFNAGTAYQSSKKGQVKITGKLGLNHDDQYVLQCDASIDDQPFETMYQTHRVTANSYDSPYRRYCDCPQDMLNQHSTSNNHQPKFKARNHKDSTVQVDLSPATAAVKPTLCPAMQSSIYRSQETQCKPAHFNQVCFSNIDKLKIYANKDETLQCNCADSDNLIIKPVQREGDIGAPNFTNPLVIISVYPKPEGSRSREASPSRAAHNVKPVADKQPARRANPMKPKIEKKLIKKNDKPPTKPEVTTTPTALQTVKSPIRSPVKTQKFAAKTEKTENIISKSEKVRPRSRSSSPPSSPTRQKVDNKILENKTIKTKKEVNRVRSPVRNANSQFGKATQQKVTMTQQAGTFCITKQTKTSHQRDTKFTAEGSKARHPGNKKRTLDTSDESSQELTELRADLPKSSKGVNTDVTLSKKAIVDSFKQACECGIDARSSWDGHTNQKHQSEWAEATTDASNVAVSIDGENEFYDELFRNGARVSDVQVRHIDTDQSLKNLLYSTDEGTPRKRSDSYAYNIYNQSNRAVTPRLSGLVARDSIELFHRRTDESDSKLVVTESLTAHDVFNKGNNKCSVSPSKHYIGDSCPVTNPIERDREIRELLGIERPKIPTISPVSSAEGSLTSPIPTPVGTPTNTPVLTPVDTPSASAPNSGEDLPWFPASLQYSSSGKCSTNALATVREISGITPKLDITSSISNKMKSTKNSEHEKIKCQYEVYQADVYTKHKHRAFDKGIVVYPLKASNKGSICCCPEDLSRKVDDLCDKPDCDSAKFKRNMASGPIGSDARMKPMAPGARVRHGDNQHTRRRIYKKRARDEKHKHKPDCCSKRACKRSSSDCSGDSTLSLNNRLSKMKIKKERRERKAKEKEERRSLRTSIKEVKRRKKLLRMKSKCTCVSSLKKLNDKCCTTSKDLIYNPRTLKCQSTITSPKNKTRSPNMKPSPIIRQNSPSRLRTLSPSRVRTLSPKTTSPSKLRDPSLKSTEGKFSCCTCKKPIIQGQLPLHKTEEPHMSRISDIIKKSEEQSMKSDRKSLLFENPEEGKDLYGSPIQSTVFGPPGENKITLSQQNTVFDQQGQQTVDEGQPYYQQLILNRNINIYLQIEKFSKQKPILLSRKQYDKVKKALDGKIGPSKSWKGRRANNCCSCSLGEVREKDGENEFNVARTVQANVCTLNRAEQACQNTSWLFLTKNETVQKVCSMTTAQIKSTGVSPKESLIQQIYQDSGPATGRNKMKELTNVKQNTKKTQYKVPESVRHTQNVINYIKKGEKSNNSFGIKCAQCGRKDLEVSNCSNCKKKENYKNQQHYVENDNFCNICRMVQDLEGDIIYPMVKQKSSTKRAASSAEIHYANINTEKRVTFSSSYLEGNYLREASNHFLLKKHSSNSLYTLFKGYRRKSPTPNLGTSIDSLSSENVTWKAFDADPVEEVKSRKPFLKRLMSCLVMRSKTSDVRFGRPIPKVASMNSSIDSYHINTSLNGIDLSSSIYDTSASYFTNHTILPISGVKMKRGGFLSSVKGFLSYNRKT